MNLYKRIIFLFLFIFPFIVAVIIYFSVRKPTIDIINDNSFETEEFTDYVNEGNSTSEIKKTEDNLTVTYTLKDGYLYPYAGMEIHKEGYSYFSLNHYKFRFVINASDDLRLSVRINQYIDNYTDPDNYLSYLILVKSFGLKKGLNTIEINSKNINEVPTWWFEMNPEKLNSTDNSSLEKTKAIWLFSENTTPKDKEFVLDIRELKLEYDIMPFLYHSLYLFVIYYALLVLFIRKIKKINIKCIFAPNEQPETKTEIPETPARIISFIGQNYSNPELKLHDIASHAGTSEDMASELLKKYTNKSFRQYLNQIRMEEAQRLLKESDLQISEIAFKVGYNNIQHFNRVFKEYTNLSPKAYRES